MNDGFKANVEELNTRFRQAGYPFHYHNYFVQVSRDELTLGSRLFDRFGPMAKQRPMLVEKSLRHSVRIACRHGR